MAQALPSVSDPNQVAVSSGTAYIGLTKSALDLIGSSNPITQLAHNIVRWLGRERINESDFTYCIERCRALAHPNEHGLAVRESIIRSERRIAKVGGLHLITAGAIGHWMAFSQDHAYMVTTVAVAARYQGMRFASQLLCELILKDMDGSMQEDKNSYSYSVCKARLMGVLTKIVESISLNVVNPGHNLAELPEELRSLCVHLVDAQTFARMILKITRSDADMLLLCDRFQGDLLLWTLAHFEGSIEVSVAACRVPLYSIEPPDYSRNRDLLNREEKYHIWTLAQRFVLWMLDLPLQTNYDFTTIGFETNFQLDATHSEIRIGDILHRLPTILHNPGARSLGKLTPVTFIQPEPKESEGSDISYDPVIQPLSMLCAYFPALSDLLADVSKRCKCRICRNEGIVDECKEGCLREAASSHLFLLIGNAIADGFGVRDASGLLSLNDYTYEVHKLLSQLTDGYVWWDHWFNVAASTVLGYVSKGVLGPAHLDEGAYALVAVQHGSNVVAAKWLDLSKKLRVQKCFGLEIAEGKIPDSTGEFAFIYSEVKMELCCDMAGAKSQLPSHSLSDWARQISEKDQSSPKLQQAIIGSQAEETLRLITFVGTGLSQRIIDPADALAAAIRSTFLDISRSSCQRHAEPIVQVDDASTETPSEQWYIWSFDEALKNWEIENRDNFFTNCLDTELKLNVALSLSAKGCVVREASTCFSCALDVEKNSPREFCRRIITYDTNKHVVRRGQSSVVPTWSS